MAGQGEKKNEKRDPTRPVKVFRVRGVSASVFENASDDPARPGVWYRVSLQRTYKQGDEFKTTSSFGRDDIPVARHVLRLAWEFVLQAEADQRTDHQE